MLTRIETADHEEVYRVRDREAGLTGYIALHSTLRGPAAGGLRMRPYGSEEEALADVLRLSRGMTFKNAAADLPLGGGKAVIIGDPAADKTPALLRAMGRAVEALEGRYWTAEDMGMSPADMRELARETRYVAGLAEGDFASGDPSPVTARGVFNALRIGCKHRFGSADLHRRHVAVQGLGHVGMHLCNLLHQAGAVLTVCDPDHALVARAVEKFDAVAVPPDAIYGVGADVFAPCAIGGVLNGRNIRQLRVGLVAGGANNQLAGLADADALQARGILYAPDYVANGGGIINVATEILQVRDSGPWVAARLAALEETMERTLSRAIAGGISPARIADSTIEAAMLRPAA
jgi:leucine dehydrogenase